MRRIKLDNGSEVALFPSEQQALDFAAKEWITVGKTSIEKKGAFTVALSGGRTPKALFERVFSTQGALEWPAVKFFWSDERSVPCDDPASNYRMAMDAGLSKLSVPHVYRMEGVGDLETNSLLYENLIKREVPGEKFDLIMLGVGNDGHTASLFPTTSALEAKRRLVVPNFVASMNTWRLTMTFECLQKASHVVIYALGKEKAPILERIFVKKENFPVTHLMNLRPVLFIVDAEAAPFL